MDELLGHLWASLVASLGGEATALVFVALLVFGMWVLWRIQQAVVRSEFYKKNQLKIDLLDDVIVNFIFLAAFGNVDLTPWQVKADKRVEDGLEYIDPRMLYVVDKAEEFANSKFHLNLEFDDLLARAERIFQEYKHSEETPIE